MRLFKRKLRKDSRGLSLVELICAVAILGAISTAIGGAMLVSANSYKRGTEEAELQKASEFAANVIEGLIVDATNTVDYDSSTHVLTITNVDHTYTIQLNGTKLYYSEDGGANTVLAEGVVGFSADASDFLETRKLAVTLDMQSDSGRTINTVYNIMSRNNPKSSTLVAVPGSATIDVMSEITLEPNQSYEIPVVIHTSGGAGTEYSAVMTGVDDGNTKVVSINANSVVIAIGRDEKGGADGKVYLTLTTNAVDPVTSSPYDTRTVTVNIRRVRSLDMELKLVSGDMYKENSVYQVTKHDAEPKFVKGTSLPQVPGAVYDTSDASDPNHYVDPYGAVWSFVVDDGSGGSVNDYVQVVTKVEDASPYINFKLKKDLPAGAKLQVWAQAKHPDGTNKTGMDYDPVENHVDLQRTGWYNYNSDFLRGHDFCIVTYNFDLGAIRTAYGGQVEKKYRCRKVNLDDTGNVVKAIGEWSGWMDSGDNGTDNLYMRPKNMTQYLDPSVAYEIEVRTQIIKDGVAVWPDASTPDGQALFSFTIPAVSTVYTTYDLAGNTGTLPAGCTGWELDDRLHIALGQEGKVKFQTIAGHSSKCVQEHMKTTISKLNGDGLTWDVVTSNVECVPQFDGGDTYGYLKVKFGDQNNNGMNGHIDERGTYMVELSWDDTYKGWFGSGVSYMDGSGKGVIYFEVE